MLADLEKRRALGVVPNKQMAILTDVAAACKKHFSKKQSGNRPHHPVLHPNLQGPTHHKTSGSVRQIYRRKSRGFCQISHSQTAPNRRPLPSFAVCRGPPHNR